MSKLRINKSLRAYNVYEIDIDYHRVFNLVSNQIGDINESNLNLEQEGAIHLKGLSLPLYAYIPKWLSLIHI